MPAASSEIPALSAENLFTEKHDAAQKFYAYGVPDWFSYAAIANSGIRAGTLLKYWQRSLIVPSLAETLKKPLPREHLSTFVSELRDRGYLEALRQSAIVPPLVLETLKNLLQLDAEAVTPEEFEVVKGNLVALGGRLTHLIISGDIVEPVALTKSARKKRLKRLTPLNIERVLMVNAASNTTPSNAAKKLTKRQRKRATQNLQIAAARLGDKQRKAATALRLSRANEGDKQALLHRQLKLQASFEADFRAGNVQPNVFPLSLFDALQEPMRRAEYEEVFGAPPTPVNLRNRFNLKHSLYGALCEQHKSLLVEAKAKARLAKQANRSKTSCAVVSVAAGGGCPS